MLARTRMKHHQLLRRELRCLIVERFNEVELKNLCFELGIDYEILNGVGKLDKARELITYLERRERLDRLLIVGTQMRPDVPWPHLNSCSPEDDMTYSPSARELLGSSAMEVAVWYLGFLGLLAFVALAMYEFLLKDGISVRVLDTVSTGRVVVAILVWIVVVAWSVAHGDFRRKNILR